jgi:dihydroorotase
MIKNSKVFIDGLILDCCLAIEEGKIIAIGKETKMPHSDQVIDAGGNIIIPGLLDVHVHFRDPGFTHKEDFYTGSSAAAAGGVTTIIDEPNNIPTTTTLGALKQKIKTADKRSVVDYSFSYGLNHENIGDIPDVFSHGILSFDIFTGGMGDKLSINDTGVFFDALSRIHDLGALACITCGDSELNRWSAEKVLRKGGNDINAYGKASLSVSEALGVAKNILLAGAVGTKIHLRQISTLDAVNFLKIFKTNSPQITSEVSPHHLLLDTQIIQQLGPFGKVGPPVRSIRDKNGVWSAFADGTLDIVATDHAPHSKEEKEKGKNDVWKAPSGLPGIETLLPLMLTQVNKDRISLKRVVEATAELPAKIFGLYPRKGAIEVGSDADLVIIDLKRNDVFRGDSLCSKADWTPFEGWEHQGKPLMTFVRGIKVMEEGSIIVKPGHGSFIPSHIH